MSASYSFEAIDNRLENFSRRLAQKSSDMRGLLRGPNSSAGLGSFMSVDNISATNMYAGIRDTAYASLRPICARYASQPIRVALVPRRRQGMRIQSGRLLKECRLKGWTVRGDKAFDRHQSMKMQSVPLAVKQYLPAGSILLDDHPIDSMFQAPNEFTTQSTLLSNVAASLMSAGMAYLLFDAQETTPDAAGDASSTVYYVPKTWVTPGHKNGPFSEISVSPPSTSKNQVFNRGEFARIALWNPADPLGSISPMLALASAINSGRSIEQAHSAALRNVFSPRYAITAGQAIEGSSGGRPLFDAAKRRELSDEFRQMASGALRAGDPIFLDAFISKIERLGDTPNELDFLESSNLVDDKIGRGFGVSKILNGFVQNANRASSAVASELFLDLVVNPTLVLSGQSLTQYIAPYFATPRYRVVIYHERAVVNDAAERRARVLAMKEYLTPEEARRFMMTGELDIDPSANLDKIGQIAESDIPNA